MTATIAYQRPLVLSPAISKPDANETVPPGPVEVRFTACDVCNQAGDSVTGLLEQGATDLAMNTLLSTDDNVDAN